MPMMVVCDKLAYTPGQIITGHVVVISKSPQKVKGLTMRFIGRSSKLLGEVEGTKRYKREVYFDEKMDIFGHDGTNTLLRVGETLYPFTFPLPAGLPSSFEWPDGNVLYFVEAKLTRASWKDKRISTRVRVEGVFDLNFENSATLAVEVKRQKYVRHLLTKSGPYGFTFKCGRSGFVRGQSLPFSVEIKNLSKVDSRKLKISILQEVKCDGGKSVASLVEQMKGPALTAGEVLAWEARLKIPAGIPPTNLGNILSYPMVIPVNYFLHVQLSLKNCREDPICIKIPIIIGTLPLQRRAVSVPSLDEHSNSPLYSYINNGHRLDCPMSQLMLPSPAISTSQFSPHLVSINAATSYPRGPRGQNMLPYHTFSPRSHRIQQQQPLQILRPVGEYEYYFEYDDANNVTRSITSRGDSTAHRRRNLGSLGRNGRCFNPESPPPSYDEIFTGQATVRESGSVISPNANDGNTNIPEIILTSSSSVTEQIIHKRVRPEQLSSSSSSSPSASSSSEDEDNSSLVLPLANNTNTVDDNDALSCSSDSGTVTPSSSSEDSDSEDSTGSIVFSTVEDFLSGSGSSSSFEELKCHDLQNSRNTTPATTDELKRLEELTIDSDEDGTEVEFNRSHSHLHHHQKKRPCPCEKVNVNRSKSISNISDFQGGCNPSTNNNSHASSYCVQNQNHVASSTKCGEEDDCCKNSKIGLGIFCNRDRDVDEDDANDS